MESVGTRDPWPLWRAVQRHSTARGPRGSRSVFRSSLCGAGKYLRGNDRAVLFVVSAAGMVSCPRWRPDSGGGRAAGAPRATTAMPRDFSTRARSERTAAPSSCSIMASEWSPRSNRDPRFAARTGRCCRRPWTDRCAQVENRSSSRSGPWTPITPISSRATGTRRARFRAQPIPERGAIDDALIGQLADQLKKMGLADNTLLVITGDHGEAFNEHGQSIHGFTYTMKSCRFRCSSSIRACSRMSGY